jgi:hypothetical protein
MVVVLRLDADCFARVTVEEIRRRVLVRGSVASSFSICHPDCFSGQPVTRNVPRRSSLGKTTSFRKVAPRDLRFGNLSFMLSRPKRRQPAPPPSRYGYVTPPPPRPKERLLIKGHHHRRLLWGEKRKNHNADLGTEAGHMLRMPKQINPFREIKQNHGDCVLNHLSLVAFGSSTYRIFGKGSGKKLREFVVAKIGDGRRFASGRDFEREHAKLVHQFPPTIRLNANTNKKPGYAHKAKVIDLYLKTLYSHREPLNAAIAKPKRLGQRLHVPLDCIVLKSVWREFSHQLDEKGVAKRFLALSKLGKKHYHAVQEILAHHAKQAGTIAILYDVRWAVGSEQARNLKNTIHTHQNPRVQKG